jgi:methionyl aminopeptidase
MCPLLRQVSGIRLKTAQEITLMRSAGRIVAEVHARLQEIIQPGVCTADLDAVAAEIIRSHGAVAAFLGYPNAQDGPAYPATVCTSVNDELVHGIPRTQRVLQDGDIVSVDVGAVYKGYYGDSGWTYAVGKVGEEAQRLLEVTEASLWAGIAQARVGNRFVDISAAIQQTVEGQGFSVVREYTSHGIGRRMHEEPQILNYVPDRGETGRMYPSLRRPLKRGMTMALEPMVNAGDWRTRLHEDKWTVSTADGSLSAHFEHTIAITDGEPEILTRL